MFLDRRHSRYVAWIACAAIVASALLPSLVRAAQVARGVPAVVAELCSVRGGAPILIRAASAPDHDPSGQGVATHIPHCPGCLSSHDPVVLPALCGAAAAPPDPQSQPAPQARQGPAPRASWSPANPRAPPAAD